MEDILIHPCFICTFYGCYQEKHQLDKKTLEFIKKAREIHGWKYGYEKTKYTRSRVKIVITCGVHGDFEQNVYKHLENHGCKICAGKDSKTAEINFRKSIEEIGGKVIGEYKRNKISVECICLKGHQCNPRPSDIQQGGGMCKICAGKDSKTAEINFRKSIEEIGGKVIGEYKRNNIPVECICPKGHQCNPIPSSIQQGQGMCKICAGNDSKTAEINFRKSIEELGGKVIGEYKGNKISVECICPKGHKCNPRPNDIQKGTGMCKICAGKDSKTAEINFRKSIEEIGGKVIGEYKGNKISVECICPKGHQCNPIPNYIQQGRGMCKICLLCPSCGLWRTCGILCSYCKPYIHNKLYSKTKEMTVVRFLKEKLPDEEFIHNRSVGRDCTDGHLFPDIRFDRIFYNLIVEVDEHKHTGSGYECDEKRMYDIIAKLGTPCIFLRYNPDAKDSCREILLEKIQAYLDVDEEGSLFPWDEYGFNVEYLFY
jgi:stress response protein YsnF